LTDIYTQVAVFSVSQVTLSVV